MPASSEAQAIFERYAAAAVQGEKDRHDVLFSRITRQELEASRRERTAQTGRFINRWQRKAETRRRDRLMGPELPLLDDGSSDLVFCLLNPDRRYRVRAWRYSDGEPVLHRAPGVTIVDFRGARTQVGTPYGHLADYGYMVREEDSDEWAELWFKVERLTNGWRVRPKAAGKPK